MPYLGKYQIVLHPQIQADSDRIWKSTAPHVILLGPGITPETMEQLVDQYIHKCSQPRISVHVACGVYEGEKFDNTTLGSILYLGENQVVLRHPFPDIFA
jgi:hypothetical protein